MGVAHWNEATLRLLTGDLGAKAEWREQVPRSVSPRRLTQRAGSAALDGKTILVMPTWVWATASIRAHIPLLAGRGARVVARSRHRAHADRDVDGVSLGR